MSNPRSNRSKNRLMQPSRSAASFFSAAWRSRSFFRKGVHLGEKVGNPSHRFPQRRKYHSNQLRHPHASRVPAGPGEPRGGAHVPLSVGEIGLAAAMAAPHQAH